MHAAPWHLDRDRRCDRGASFNRLTDELEEEEVVRKLTAR
jgi:hypothetical protein